MADASESKTGIYFAVILVIAALVGLVWLARDVARGTASDLRGFKKAADTNRTATSGTVADDEVSASAEDAFAKLSNWVTYRDQSWGYSLRFPKSYRVRLLDASELRSALPGETILSGIVVTDSAAVSNKLPDYRKPSFTLLVTDWPSFGTSRNFLNETYLNGAVSQSKIERLRLNGTDALRLQVHATQGSQATSHTELLVTGPSSRVFKVIYWPADDKTLSGIASTISISE